MHTIYIDDNSVLLKKRSDRILLKKGGKVLDEIPTLDLKRVVVFGNNQISTELMRHLSSKGIEVSFLSYRGRFRFRVVPEMSKNIYLRMAQHDRYRDDGFRIHWSRIITGAKIRNQRNFLMRQRKNRPDLDLNSEVSLLKTYAQNVSEKQTIEEIMGVEGFSARIYFSAYGRLILKGFEFKGRKYYPPPDPINALLSFGYMLVFNELNSLLEAFGFDVFLGFLHSVRRGRASLASDLIEELRSPVVDRLVMYLINLDVVRPSQFRTEGGKGVRMDDRAIKAYLKNYEKFMTTPFTDVKTREQKNYRQVIRERVEGAERTLMHDAEYVPYIFYS